MYKRQIYCSLQPARFSQDWSTSFSDLTGEPDPRRHQCFCNRCIAHTRKVSKRRGQPPFSCPLPNSGTPSTAFEYPQGLTKREKKNERTRGKSTKTKLNGEHTKRKLLRDENKASRETPGEEQTPYAHPQEIAEPPLFNYSYERQSTLSRSCWYVHVR